MTAAALVLSLLFQADGAADASGWQASFPPAAIATYFEGTDHAVLVAASGGPGARQAAQALVASLRASGRTRFVMDDASLGDLTGSSDAQILERARAAPVDTLATVRVFPGSEGEPPIAVVTLYENGGGAVLSALSAPFGRPAPAREGKGVAGGVSSSALQTVNEIGKEHAPKPSQPASPQATYDNRYLWFRHPAGVPADWEPLQGRIANPVDVDTFFERIGREDLAERYRNRRLGRVGLWVGGSMALTGGAVVALMASLGVNCARVSAPSGTCLSPDGNLELSGVVIAGAGLVAIVAGFFLSPYPVEASEAERMANDYNQRLKRQLGVTRREEATPRWAVGPFVIRGGMGAGFRVSL